MATTYDPCYRNPCQNGGTCYPKRASYWPYQYTEYSCQCDSYHYGQKCQYYGRPTTERPTEMATQSCQNGGYYDYYNGRCRCQAGTWGYYCQYGSVTTPLPPEETTLIANTTDTFTGKKIRLVGGRSVSIGRVEVYHNGQWGTVCDDSFDNTDAQVVCRMLGYSPYNARAYSSARFGQGRGPIWLDDLRCRGYESSVFDCSHGGLGTHNCGHSEDAGVSCYNDTDLSATTAYSEETTAANEITTEMPETTTHDPCSQNPCQYGGTCIRTNSYYWPYTGYRCNCPYYRTGQKCEYGAYGYQETTAANEITTEMPESTTSDPCSRNPCQYGGTCIRTSSYYWPYTGYRCNCPYYRTGQKCEYSAYGYRETTAPNEITTAMMKTTPYDPCSQNPCQYGGTCIRTNRYYWPYTGYRCNCPYYRTGQKCEYSAYGYQETTAAEEITTTVAPEATTYDPCSQNPCQYGGTCIRTNSYYWPYTGYRCNCPYYRTGQKCEYGAYGYQTTEIPNLTTEEYVGVRLVGGNSYREGRVMVYYDGRWGTICDHEFDDNDARVVCRMLGFGDRYAKAYGGACFGEGSGKIWLNHLHCQGTESSLAHCYKGYGWGNTHCSHSEDVGVSCGFSYTRSCTNYNYTTGGPPTAQVETTTTYDPCSSRPCYYGGTCVPQRSYYWPYNYVDYNCTCPWARYGKRCEYYGWPTTESPMTESITPKDIPVRLVGGYSNREGRVEVYYNGRWGTVCDDNFDSNDARVICRMLGFGDRYARSYGGACYGAGSGPIWLDLKCSGSEYSIANCNYTGWGINYCGHQEDAAVSCGYSYSRSCPGSSQYGRQTTENPTTKTTSAYDPCSRNPCQYGGTCVRTSSYYWPYTGYRCNCPYYRTGQKCEYSAYGYPETTATNEITTATQETTTYDPCSRNPCQYGGTCIRTNSYYWPYTGYRCNCPYYRTGQKCEYGAYGYQTTEIPNLTTVKYVRVRLVGGNSYREGRVMVYYDGRWGTICDHDFDDNDARVVCRMLGHGDRYAKAYGGACFGEGSGKIWLNHLHCQGTESSIAQCYKGYGWGNTHCSHSEDVGVSCGFSYRRSCTNYNYTRSWPSTESPTIETVTPPNPCSYNPCYNGGTCVPRRSYDWPYNFVDYNCTCPWDRYGKRCEYYGWPTTENSTTESVTSTAQVRLVGGYSNREGRVEVYYNGRWGTVCDDGFDDRDARVICSMLGFGDRYAKAYQSACYGQGYGQIWLDGISCSGGEHSLSACSHQSWGVHDCSHSEDAGVSCGYSYTRSCPGSSQYATTEAPENNSSRYDPCSSYPCYYGGTCVPQRSYYWPYDYVDFNCTCPWARYGKRCEYYGWPTTQSPETEMTTNDPCYPNPCQNNGYCSPTGYWGPWSQPYRCSCPSYATGYKCETRINSYNYYNPKVSVNCDSTKGMTVTVDVNDIQSRLGPMTLTLDESKCVPDQYLGRNAIFHVPLVTQMCGTRRLETRDTFIYRNALILRPYSNSLINRNLHSRYTVECVLPRYGDVGEKFVAKGTVYGNRVYVASGNFTLRMDLYHSGYFTSPVTSYPHVVRLNQDMYVDVALLTPDINLKVVLQNCVATPKATKSYPQYALISNKCPDDPTVRFYPSNDTHAQFAVKAFEFFNDPEVYLHCDVIVCNATDRDSRCLRPSEGYACPQNGGRGKRAVPGDVEVYSLVQGPVFVQKENPVAEFAVKDERKNQEDGGEGPQAPPSTTIGAGVMAVSACVVVIAAVIVTRKRRSTNAEYIPVRTDEI